jgi:hypothetical protein
LKILHLEDGKRAIRGERAAMLGRKIGIRNQLIAGPVQELILDETIFKKMKYIPFTPKNRLGFNQDYFLTKLEEFIEEIDPDIIHAHNIVMAEIARKIGLPFIYDDHECWSQQIKYSTRRKIKGIISLATQKLRYPRWEKRIITSTPVLVPSKGIRDFYKEKYNAPHVYRFPNMPLLEEVDRIQFLKRDNKELITVVIGVSTKVSRKSRNIEGFIDCWKDNDDIGKLMIIGQNDLESEGNLISTGWVSHFDCYKHASKGHIGVIPFKPHKYHRFSGALKAYLYIHSGLPLVTPKSQLEFKHVIDTIGTGFQFENYAQLVKYLQDSREKLLSLDNKKIIKIARKEFVLDNYSDVLKKVYKIALE